jgi:hypothetical protein
MELKALVQEKFSEPQKCYGHCDQQSTLKFLDDEEVITAVYSCPGSYISKVIVYGDSVDLDHVLGYMRDLVGKEQDVREEDIRVASRYPWDLGIEDTGSQERVMGAAYWTQNYRRTKSDDPNRAAVFLCGNCRSVFSQPMSSRQTLCPECRI